MDRLVARFAAEDDPIQRYDIVGASNSLRLFDTVTKAMHCNHTFTRESLQDYIENRAPDDSELCPECHSATTAAIVMDKETASNTEVGALQRLPRNFDVDAFFFDAFNTEPDWTAADRLHPSMYGDYVVLKDVYWEGSYAELLPNHRRVRWSFDHGPTKGSSDRFRIAYDVWMPKSVAVADPSSKLSSDRMRASLIAGDISIPNLARNRVSVIVLTHGVPVNRREWYAVARILSRFYVVVTVDLLGMGDSSMPLDFVDRDDKSMWSWGVHARVFQMLFRDLFPEGGALPFFGGNDWGVAPIQLTLERSSHTIRGANMNSGVYLNGYWVQHIGALRALSLMPYPSDMFTVSAVAWIGQFTALLETMFHRTDEIHNQYTMAPLQQPYVEVEAYWNVDKNPANTVYKAHAIRVLAQQASYILGNGQLLPYHRNKNPRGMHISRWDAPILMMHGVERMAQTYWGLTEIARQDEQHVMKMFDELLL